MKYFFGNLLLEHWRNIQHFFKTTNKKAKWIRFFHIIISICADGTEQYFDSKGKFLCFFFSGKFVALTKKYFNGIQLYPDFWALVEVTICLSKKKHQKSVNVTEMLGTVPWLSYLFWIGRFILVKTKIMHFLCFYNESFSVYGACFFRLLVLPFAKRNRWDVKKETKLGED